MSTLETPRLTLRLWHDADADVFASINADKRVMEYLPSTITQLESNNLLTRIRTEFDNEQFGLWAVERKDDQQLIGFTGLHRVGFDGHLKGEIEIGWRICYDAWGCGYAPEAACACLDFAQQIGIQRVISFTSRENIRSQRVMEKIGMQRDAEFNHPALQPKDPLLRHILYHINFKI